MKKIIFFLLIVPCLAYASPATDKESVLSGIITDAGSGEPLIGATVYFPEFKTGTTTNTEGRYTIERLPKVKTTVQISYIAHRTIIENVDLRSVSKLDFAMQESDASLNEVVVTGLTGQALMRQSPSPMQIVTSRELASRPSSNIIDALAKQPGVSQVTTGGAISKPIIRGLGYNRVVVVSDGVRQEGQQWGDEHGIEVDANSVYSAEILKGPASLMYGSDALAGVLVLNGEPVLAKGEMRLKASTEYQTNNGMEASSISFAGNRSGIVWNMLYSDKAAHAYKNRLDGYVVNSQFRERALSGMVGTNRQWGYSHLLLSYYNIRPGIVEGERDEDTGELERPSDTYKLKTYGKALPFQQVRHYKAVLDNAFFIDDGILKVRLGYQQNMRQEFEEEPNEAELDFLLHTVNYDLRYVSPEKSGRKVAVGISGMGQRSLNKGEEVLLPEYNLFDIGLFATSTWELNKWMLSGGLRFDNRHLHGDELRGRFEKFSRNFSGVTGSVGAIYNLDSNTNLRVNLSRGFRTPNISELASNGVHEGTFRYEIGNHDLKSEAIWQLDLGADYSSSILSAQVSLFANHISHFVYLHSMAGVITDGRATYHYEQGTARLFGGECMVDFHPIERLHFENTFSYVNARLLHRDRDSKWVPFTPSPRWTSDLRYDFIRDGRRLNNAYVSVGLECNLRQNHCYLDGGTETPTPSYTLVNAAVGGDILLRGKTMLSVYLTANNLFDRAYQSHLSRLKYADVNPVTGRRGVYNMGRNFGVKVVLPVLF